MEGHIDDGETTAESRRSGHWMRPDGTPYQRPPPPEGFRESRRWVICHAVDVPKSGRNGRTFGYNVKTVARLAGVTPNCVRKAVRAAELVMHDLSSVLGWVIRMQRLCPAGRTGDPAVAPDLWAFYDNYTLLWSGNYRPRSDQQIQLAVQMPQGQMREDMVRLFWQFRHRLAGFAGNRRDLARRIFELDGIRRADQTTSMVIYGSHTLRALIEAGVLLHDQTTKVWSMAPFPADHESVSAALQGEGFETQIVHRHIVIGREWFSLSDAKRLLAYARTNRIKGTSCGRDKRLWIVAGMDRAMHGYKTRQVFRRSGLGVAAKRVASDAANGLVVP